MRAFGGAILIIGASMVPVDKLLAAGFRVVKGEAGTVRVLTKEGKLLTEAETEALVGTLAPSTTKLVYDPVAHTWTSPGGLERFPN